MKFKHALVLMALGFSMNAFADGWAKGPCAEDVKKLCSDVEKGEGRVIKCLKEHEAQLSEACKAKRDEKKGKRKEMNQEKRKEHLEARKTKIEEKLKKLEESKAAAPGSAPAAP